MRMFKTHNTAKRCIKRSDVHPSVGRWWQGLFAFTYSALAAVEYSSAWSSHGPLWEWSVHTFKNAAWSPIYRRICSRTWGILDQLSSFSHSTADGATQSHDILGGLQTSCKIMIEERIYSVYQWWARRCSCWIVPVRSLRYASDHMRSGVATENSSRWILHEKISYGYYYVTASTYVYQRWTYDYPLNTGIFPWSILARVIL